MIFQDHRSPVRYGVIYKSNRQILFFIYFPERKTETHSHIKRKIRFDRIREERQRETKRQRDRKTDRQTERQTGRQTE